MWHLTKYVDNVVIPKLCVFFQIVKVFKLSKKFFFSFSNCMKKNLLVFREISDFALVCHGSSFFNKLKLTPSFSHKTILKWQFIF
jgi:hypothetical protein